MAVSLKVSFRDLVGTWQASAWNMVTRNLVRIWHDSDKYLAGARQDFGRNPL